MTHCHIDHLVITSPALEKGAAFVLQTLGVVPQTGGAHPRMGTHNLLLRLSDSMYLEVISPNPRAPLPGRPRWFDLDAPADDAQPGLCAWVVSTTDIKVKARSCSESLGKIEPMSRGALNWLITVTDDGSVPVDGVGPALIEWHADVHPASTLHDVGLALVKLEIFHPDPDRVRRMLASMNFDGSVQVAAVPDSTRPHLAAHISTPQGLRLLSAPGRNYL